MDTIINLLSLLGSLGLFLYGMNIMSTGLQKFAGNRLRSILAAMTKNRFAGMFTGILITALIQSSSATTVMVVSFVNAGLMTLAQSIGVIMGANVGTTVTAWIISAVGFKVNIAAFALPLLAFGIPLMFSGKSSRKSMGEFVFGFCFLFMGLSYLQKSAEALDIGTMVAHMLSGLAGGGSFWVVLLFVLVGALVTMVVQASAATMAITLMLFDMNIPGFGFELAAALAMGQNIGTTITAFIASLTANTQARRAAMAHLFFNVFGVVVVLIVFHPFCDAISYMLGAGSNDLFKLSAFHTAFNVLNTLLLIGFVKQIEKLVCTVLPEKQDEDEYRLHFISRGLTGTPELSILEAQKEITVFAQRCRKMFLMVEQLLTIEKDEEFTKLFSKIQKYEEITDRMEIEIATYLNQVSEGHLSYESKTRIQNMNREVSELESIGDACFNLARTINSKRMHHKNKEDFTNGQYERVHNMMALINQSLESMINVVNAVADNRSYDINHSINIENEINNYRDQLKEQNLVDIDENTYSYQMSVYYMDLVRECERLGDYVMNVVEATNSKLRERKHL